MGILEGIASDHSNHSDPARACHIKPVQTGPNPALTGDVSETAVVLVLRVVRSLGLVGMLGDFSHSPAPWDCCDVLCRKHVNISPHLTTSPSLRNVRGLEAGTNPTSISSMYLDSKNCITSPRSYPLPWEPGTKGGNRGWAHQRS